MKKLRKHTITTFVFTIALIILSFSILEDKSDDSILGKWMSDDTSNWVLEFKSDGKCYEYYNNSLSKTYFYSFSNTSPKCGYEVPIGELFEYLILTNINDSQDIYCYEFLGVDNNNNFAIIYINGSINQPMGFVRDCNADSDSDGYNDCEDPNNAVNNTTITSNFTEDKGGWLNSGKVSTTLEEGRLKVSDVDSSWEGVRRPLDELRIAPGQQLNISFDFDQGNTQAGVRVYIQELDGEGNHILWNVFDSSTPTGHHNYTYTIKTGHKAILRIDKDNTHLEETTHFYVDNIEVKLLDCTLDSDKDGYNDCEDANNAVNNTTITSNFTEDKGGWLNSGKVSTTLEEGRLKVSDVDSSWEGVQRPLDELRIAPGQQLNISFDFDRGNTQAGVRVYIQELDAEGNHILWNVFDNSTATGHHNYTYTIKTGHKAILRIDKDNTHLEETTHFYVDTVVVTKI